MQTFQADLAIVGAGGAGLRAAIAAAQANPNAKIALISKVYPMRSHTVAAEGGSAAVAQDHDSFEYHFHDTVAGGDWLCEQDVVDYFVHHCPTEMTQLELWGCPWSRRPDGSVNVRRFGGMKIERTWFAADKTGKQVKPGNHIGDISNAIEVYATEHNLGVVKELVGHGVGTTVHEDPEVPNYGEKGKGPRLREGMVIAIEPMLTLGSPDIYVDSNDWTVITDDGSRSAHFEHTVAVTSDGVKILTGDDK